VHGDHRVDVDVDHAGVRVDLEETVVEVYARLMRHLAKDDLSGTVTSWVPPIVYVKENDNLIIQGARITELTALAEMAIPDHEDVVEVSKAAIRALLEEGHEAADG
jgi:hypothetical protein